MPSSKIKLSNRNSHSLRLLAEQERITQDNYLRGVEDRAHREVDRAREEEKTASRKHYDVQRKLESARSELSRAQ